MIHSNSKYLQPNFKVFVILLLVLSVALIPIDYWYKSFRYSNTAVLPVPQAIRGLGLLIFGTYLFRTGLFFEKYNFKYGTIFNCYVLLWIFHSIISGFSFSTDVFFILKSLFFIVFTTTAYRLHLSNHLSSSQIHKAVVLSALIASVYAILYMLDPSVEPGQNVGAYTVLWCLPILMNDRSLKGMLLIFICFVAIFITVKRGPALAVMFGTASYLAVQHIVSRRKLDFRQYFFGAFILIALLFALYSQFDKYQQRVEDAVNISSSSSQEEIDKLGSGRVLLARLHLTNYLKGNTFQHFFGFGNMADFISYGKYRGGAGLVAHSSWIEMIYNYGLVGVILFTSFFVLSGKILLTLIRFRCPIAPAFAMGITCFLLSSIYSQVLFSIETIYFGFLLSLSYAEYFKAKSILYYSIRPSITT